MIKKVTISLVIATAISTSSFAFGLGNATNNVPGMGGSSSSEKVDTDKVLEQVLKKINMAKKLEEDSKKIKAEMLSALNISMGMGATTNYLINYQATALGNANSAEQAREVFNKGIANIINAKKNPSGGIAEKESVLGVADGSIKSDVKKLDKILKMSNEDIESTIKNIEASTAALELANAMLREIGDRSDIAIEKIDNSIETFKSKGGSVAIESVKMVGILALQVKSLKSVMQSVSKNPMQAAKVLPKLKNMISDLQNLINVLKNYKADYDYIEKESVKISKAAKNVVQSIKLAKSYSKKYLQKIEDIASKRVDLKTLKNEIQKESAGIVQKATDDLTADIEM